MTTATSSTTSRTWLIMGGILVIALICLASLLFVVNRYQNAMTAYAWVQSATDSSTNLNELLCADAPQARRFNTAFRNRYARQNISIDLQNFEQNDREVILEGNIEIDGERDDFRTRFIIGEDGNTGFLGLFGCIERIEQLEPTVIPQPYWGG